VDACEKKISGANKERLYIDDNIICTYNENYGILMRVSIDYIRIIPCNILRLIYYIRIYYIYYILFIIYI
jgi:hypothetical protein